jgi:2-amino-4-hydroxy-6-hydroxymethyldihydropteridine diphosphokinase
VAEIVYLSLGSNIGDLQANLRTAIYKLGALGEVVVVSSFYETEPVDVAGQPWFLNCVVAMRTHLSPQGFLSELLGIEQEMGRHRTQPKGPRLIDIDILLFGDAVIHEPQLDIPHPAMHQRRFVLEPLAEIAPETLHPTLHHSVQELLQALPPHQGLVKKSAGFE